MTQRVYVGIGSNLDREKMIRAAIAALRERFGELELSPVYNSASVGFDGSDFLNLVAGFDTPLGVEALVTEFHRIEDALGRDRSLPKFASRPIDIDILLYADEIIDLPGIRVPRPEIRENAFVLKPLQDLVPQRCHPETGERFAILWQQMAPAAPRLDPYPLEL